MSHAQPDLRQPVTVADLQAALALTFAHAAQLGRRSGGGVTPIDPPAVPAPRPLAPLLQRWRTGRIANDITPAQADASLRRLEVIFGDLGITHVADLKPEPIERWFGQFARAKAGRCGHDGLSAQTRNHYLASLRHFVKFLLDEEALDRDPTTRLVRASVTGDVRHPRRELTAAELDRLIEVTMRARPIETIPGPDRVMLYALAGWTGLRKSELGSLTTASFSLGSDPPTVFVPGSRTKNGQATTMVLHPKLATEFARWFRTLPSDPARLLWPISRLTSVDRKTHKMIRLDLQAAGIPYQDLTGAYADFHALRHTFISALARAGVSVSTAQKLARHSDPKLTLNVYTHVRRGEEVAAVNSLAAPPILVPRPPRPPRKRPAPAAGEAAVDPATPSLFTQGGSECPSAPSGSACAAASPAASPSGSASAAAADSGPFGSAAPAPPAVALADPASSESPIPSPNDTP